MRALRYKTIALSLAAACLLAVSCTDEKSETLEYLCDGYWLEETSESEAPSHIVSFDASGHVFYYKYTYNADDQRYHISYDNSVITYKKYKIDTENSLLCLLPDIWYNIFFISGNTLTLGGDGETIKKYKNVSTVAASAAVQQTISEEEL